MQTTKFVRYTTGGTPQWAVEHDSRLHSLSGLPGGPPSLGVEYDWDYIEEQQTGSLHVYE